MNTVAIVDYGMCNLDSVARAVEDCGGVPLVTDQGKDLELVSRIILPGVGAFADAMYNLRQKSLHIALYEQVVEKKIPFLGICLGMQLLATKGWEGGETEGLGWVPGEVQRLQPGGCDTRVPHIGWNEVICIKESPLFRGINFGQDFYFAHSYSLSPYDHEVILAQTPYGEGFISAVQRDLIFGVQFHPEKSQRLGFQVIRNFLSI